MTPNYTLPLTIPPTVSNIDRAWIHTTCEFLNEGDYEPLDHCGGCFQDTHPADVRRYVIETITPVALALPDPLDYKETMRVRAAAFRATRVYPGVVGEVLSRELLAWEEFGYRFGGSALMTKLIKHIEQKQQQ